ncbi:chemotaxis protein CheC [Ornithinibacillus halophilus]|uniref:Chemotaxis protein CheC n=1 Tax=Ornithinibacillus halophilus TaxID=930117 RepID=A0A1M5CBE4_9BACI|nr:chemotaxis protein CheC [Ornithinibacillus halophilus]SHF52094.1 chemotaxis protein CheC [Ornithinibacillus halophilus]
MKEQYSQIQLDALREIGNIGAGNAATSMSKLINKKVDMTVPKVEIVAFDEAVEILGGPEKLVVAIMFQIQGEAPGTVYLFFSIDEADSLVQQMTMSDDMKLFDEQENINEIAFSALQEAGNILAGSYLTALSDFTNINMQPSIPHLSIDMAGALLSVGLIEISTITDYAIVIDTKINDMDTTNGINSQFFLLPAVESVSKIFNAIGINEYE